jgi:hypothetical protein
MSADSHAVCPKCYPDTYENYDDPNELRENYQFYFQQGYLHSEYQGDCWTCGYHIEFTHQDKLP